MKLSRRDLLGATATAAGLAIVLSAPVVLAAPRSPQRAPVVGFHADAPYRDKTGTDTAFRPRRAGRGAKGISLLSDEKLLTRVAWI